MKGLELVQRCREGILNAHAKVQKEGDPRKLKEWQAWLSGAEFMLTLIEQAIQEAPEEEAARGEAEEV